MRTLWKLPLEALRISIKVRYLTLQTPLPLVQEMPLLSIAQSWLVKPRKRLKLLALKTKKPMTCTIKCAEAMFLP